MTDEPSFRDGLLSISYIPRHLNAIFLQSFDFTDRFPYLVPLTTGLSLTLSAPFLFWAVRARGPLVAVTSLAVALLLLLLGWAYWERASLSLTIAVAVGVAVHACGIVVWNLYDVVK